MKLLHDYILVKEVIQNDTLEGTTLKTKYDDTERFMVVEIVEVSPCLPAEYAKYYPGIGHHDIRTIISNTYQIGNKLIINRVAKTPYKDGLYFISFKDVIALESSKEVVEDDSLIPGQMTIFDDVEN